MKKGVLLISLLTMLLSTTSCSHLIKNSDDLFRLGRHLIDVPPHLYKHITEQVTDDEKSNIKLEYYDTLLHSHKPAYNLPAITPETKITVPNIPSVKDIKKSSSTVRFERSGSSTNLVSPTSYVKCLYCNGTGKSYDNTCTHCYGTGKVMIQN